MAIYFISMYGNGVSQLVYIRYLWIRVATPDPRTISK